MPKPKDVNVKELVRKYGLNKYPNVVGWSNKLRNKIKGGRELPIPSIRIYVTKKLPESMLRKDEIIPKVVEGIPTDVVEIGRIKALAVYDKKYRPAPCGVSTSRLDERAAGTIGWWLVDEDGQLYLMSNNHVWAKENQGVQGDKLVQPGVLDGGTEDDVIAELYDFIPIDFTETGVNHVDVAIATPLDMGNLYTSIMELGGVTGKRDPQLNEEACKVGRSTGKTCGTVTDDSASVDVLYESGMAHFDDVFFVKGENVVQGGDSGSPIIGSDGKFLGLLFAGNDEGTLLVGCKQSYIESELQSRLGKKVWILVANAYPPFRERVIIQKVLPSDMEILLMYIGMTMVLGTAIPTIRELIKAYE